MPRNEPDEIVLRLSSVSRSFGNYRALHPTSLDVKRGEFFSLLGPSGCGKTTTLRVIAGFETPDTGDVWLDGQDITHTPAHLRDTNTVFQSYALFPHMSVAENVAYPLMVKGRKDKLAAKVREAIARVDMSEFSSRLPHELSGGQRQRIALARAIISEPKVLLLDEPLGALDLKLREHMQHVLAGLQKELGITFIYVTHDQGEALSMSDRIAVMKSGVVQQVGTPEDIYYRPVNAFVAGFIGKSNILMFQADRRDGVTHLSAGAIRFAAPERHTLSAALRFEALKVGDAVGLDVTGEAAVVDALFFGSTLEVTLDAGGQKLLATLPGMRGARPRAGDTVRFGFNLRDLVFLDG